MTYFFDYRLNIDLLHTLLVILPLLVTTAVVVPLLPRRLLPRVLLIGVIVAVARAGAVEKSRDSARSRTRKGAGGYVSYIFF